MSENRKNMTKKHKKRKFKIGYVVLGIVVAALIFVGVIAYNNRHNIQALYSASRSSSEDISIRQEKNNQKTQEILGTLTDADIKELPEEVREKMQTGEVTPEESLAIILGEATVESVIGDENSGSTEGKPDKSNNAEGSAGTVSEGAAGNGAPVEEEKPQEQTPVNNNRKKEEIIAKIYLLRAEYLNKIDAFIASGKATLKTIQPEDWTMSKKMSLINQFASQGNALEANCDARMEELLSELEAELTRLGESTAPIGEIRKSYEEQKQLKKEEIFSLYYPD